jgi:hypothetical protein
MQGKQLRKLEAELWRTADQLRANNKLTEIHIELEGLKEVAIPFAEKISKNFKRIS